MRKTHDNVVLFEFVTSSLSLCVLLVITIETSIEHDRRSEPSNDFVVVSLLRLIGDVERFEVFGAANDR